MRRLTVELLNSNKAYKPVLLEIMSFNQETGTGQCAYVYAGFMTNKYIYARLPNGKCTDWGIPYCIRVKRGKTGGEENYRYISKCNCSAIVRTLECSQAINLRADKRIQIISEDDPAVGIINKVWPYQILYHELSAVS